MTSLTVREYQLRRRPAGMPSPDDFALVTRTLTEPADGEVLVRNLFLSVDPYMRGRMRDVKSYVDPFPLGGPLEGAAVGRVEASRHPDLPTGTLVLSMQGWREGFLTDGRGVTPIDPALGRPESWLGTLGMPGLTAYVGLLDIGAMAPGETVLVSGAAGAVGMVACQIARARGCRVVAVVGTDAKAAWLREHQAADVTINYRTAASLRQAIAGAAPDGVHVTFENVGGEHLEAALACSRNFGRIVICGLIANYNATEPPPGPRNVRDILTRRLTVRGFLVFDHHHRRGDFLRDMAAWIAAGQMHWTETVVDGFERMPEAFLGLFQGTNLGKMVVRVG